MTDVPDSVDCPDCGQAFNPKKQGGWCTNSDCGSFKWEPDETSSSADTGGDGSNGTESTEATPDRPEPNSDNVKCSKCGESVPPKDYCLNCGKELKEASAGSETGTESAPSEPSKLTCSNCGAKVEEGWAACVQCGETLSDIDDTPPERSTPTCSNCGAEVEEDWAACVQCGASIGNGDKSKTETDGSTTPDFLTLEVGNSEVRVKNGDTVGKKVRTAHLQAGGGNKEARYIGREHALLEQEAGSFYIVNKHRNGLSVNDEEIPVDDRRRIEDGDTVNFADVASATVRVG